MNYNTNKEYTENSIQENSILKFALDYAAQGFAVFPCKNKNGVKKPITPNGFYGASTDPEVITKWWTKNPSALIATPTGETTKIFVLDIDCKNNVNGFNSLDSLIAEHGPLPTTRRVSTPSGGEHVYFKHPGSKVKTNAGVLAPGLDVRGDGGYIILPPSQIGQNSYTMLNDEPIAEAPDWLLQLVCPKDKRADRDTSISETAKTQECATSRYGARVVHAEYQKIASCPEGSRNSQLNKSAYVLGQLVSGGEIAEEEVLDALEAGGAACGLSASEAAKTIQSGFTAGKLNPRKAKANYLSDKSGKSGNPEKGTRTNSNMVPDSPCDQSDLSDDRACNPSKGYVTSSSGLYFVQERKDGDPEWLFLGPPLEFLAMSRAMDDAKWGLVVAWTNPDGIRKELIIPFSVLMGDSRQWLADLSDQGWLASPKAQNQALLKAFIASQRPNKRIRIIESVGWAGESFVLPDKVIGSNSEEAIQYIGGGNTASATKGNLEGWQKSIGMQALANSRLMFAVSASFAAPLLNVLGVEGGGIHFYGRSSSGKSTTLLAGSSVWGPPSSVLTWRSTSNGLEGILARFNDLTLCMDELGQAPSKDVGEITYMISNGRGKSRANKDGSARAVKEWRCVVLSSGEITLPDKIQEGGQKYKAGQEVRFLDIPADPGKGMGVFECLHNYSSPKDFAVAIQKACAENYGEPGRVFVSTLVEKLPSKLAEIREDYKKCTTIFAKPNVSSQIQRVSLRFALYALAGELAAEFGVVPWPTGDAILAAQQCFDDWLLNRGQTDDREKSQVIEHIKLFIARYGCSKFQLLEGGGTQIIPERVGFKRKVTEEETEYIFLPEQLENIYKGFNFRQVTTILRDTGWIKRPGKGKGLTKKITLSDLGRRGCYVIVPRDEIFDECA